MDYRPHAGWMILLTLLFALALSVYPLPLWAAWVRPDWVVLVLVYWCLYLPHRVGIASAWLVGLALDIVQGTALGQHAFALVVIAYFVHISYQRLRMFSYLQQCFVVLLLVGLHILLYQWVQNLLGFSGFNWLLFLQAVASALLWPPVRFLLGLLHLRFAVN